MYMPKKLFFLSHSEFSSFMANKTENRTRTISDTTLIKMKAQAF